MDHHNMIIVFKKFRSFLLVEGGVVVGTGQPAGSHHPGAAVLGAVHLLLDEPRHGLGHLKRKTNVTWGRKRKGNFGKGDVSICVHLRALTQFLDRR
jgi:hypothetical protein